MQPLRPRRAQAVGDRRGDSTVLERALGARAAVDET
jgi:hypothetical protein